MPNKFNTPMDTIVFTTKTILNGEKDVLYAYCDEEGYWGFLDGENLDPESGVVASLGEMLAMDFTLSYVAEMPEGKMAHRHSKEDAWVYCDYNYEGENE